METLVISLTVFVLALFVGFEVISKVPGLLHTPLMSGANAMSGITVVGALAAAGAERTTLAVVLGVSGRGPGHYQCRGRLPGDPAHAPEVPTQELRCLTL